MSTTNSLDAVLAQYEKNKQEASRPKQGPRMTDEERLQKYFSPQLDKNQTSGEAVIRILPVAEGSPFVEIYFHEVKLGGKFVKLYDPGMNEGKPSPLNETHAALMAQGDKNSKDLAKQYKAKKFYIVKVIDRANESHGPKFWRFKDSWKGDGVIDKIIPIYRKKGDIADAKDGRDLTLILTKQSTPNGVQYTAVTGIMVEDPTPLHANETTAATWLADGMTWENVYSKKPLDYLDGVSKGFEPKWSMNLKKYTWGNDEEAAAELTPGTSAEQFLQPDDAETANIADDDLPF
jgi:hypothetical protein